MRPAPLIARQESLRPKWRKKKPHCGHRPSPGGRGLEGKCPGQGAAALPDSHGDPRQLLPGLGDLPDGFMLLRLVRCGRQPEAVLRVARIFLHQFHRSKPLIVNRTPVWAGRKRCENVQGGSAVSVAGAIPQCAYRISLRAETRLMGNGAGTWEYPRPLQKVSASQGQPPPGVREPSTTLTAGLFGIGGKLAEAGADFTCIGGLVGA